MIDFELAELNQDSQWRDLLDAYSAEHLKAKSRNPEFDGWVPRLKSVEGIEDEQLPRLHGKLIAVGFLKFQLAGRMSGVWYQLSPLGKQALNQQTSMFEREDADSSEPSRVADE